MDTQRLIEARDLSKTYRRGSETVDALKDVTFTISAGEVVAVVGPSGSGKTTLLNLLGGLDTLTRGELRIAGQAFHRLNESGRTRARRDLIGFVFQDFGLIPALSALDNVILPLAFSRRMDTTTDAGALLERVGLGTRIHHRPAELSGGEMQRVAIARALVTGPSLLLADEPTGNLDARSGGEIFDLLRELNRDRGLTIVLTTHNAALADRADRRLYLENGCLTSPPKAANL